MPNGVTYFLDSFVNKVVMVDKRVSVMSEDGSSSHTESLVFKREDISSHPLMVAPMVAFVVFVIATGETAISKGRELLVFGAPKVVMRQKRKDNFFHIQDPKYHWVLGEVVHYVFVFNTQEYVDEILLS